MSRVLEILHCSVAAASVDLNRFGARLAAKPVNPDKKALVEAAARKLNATMKVLDGALE